LSENKPECQICGGGGFVYPIGENGKPDYSRVVTCACRREEVERKKAAALVQMCKLPDRAPAWSFVNFQVTRELEEAYEAAIDLADEKGNVKWLTLLGDWDRGKSHLLFAICNRWLGRGRPARYAYVPLLLKELKKGFEEKGGYDRMFDFFCKVPLLALDDLGVEKQTPWVMEELDTIINYRYVNGLPLVVTSNLTLADLSPRIASRLQRESWCRVIDIGGKEHRLGRDSHG
jgi:DNA replication protein DnaC